MLPAHVFVIGYETQASDWLMRYPEAPPTCWLSGFKSV